MQLSPEEHIGELDPKDQTTQTFDPVKEWKEKRKNLPSLNMILNMFDFEVLAKEVMGAEGWAYYNSGALDEFAMRENRLFVFFFVLFFFLLFCFFVFFCFLFFVFCFLFFIFIFIFYVNFFFQIRIISN